MLARVQLGLTTVITVGAPRFTFLTLAAEAVATATVAFKVAVSVLANKLFRR